MLKPINNHIKIEPIEHEQFMASSKGTYEEIGVVIDVAENVPLPIGCKVYFDSWLAKKYPVPNEPDKSVWFVSYEDIVAYEE